MGLIFALLPLIALIIPIVAIILSFRRDDQKHRIRELELHKEILELEIKKQNTEIRLLEEESKKYDKLIYDQ